MSDGIEFALTALESLKERCLAEWSKDPNANIPDDAFCFNECSGNGMLTYIYKHHIFITPLADD